MGFGTLFFGYFLLLNITYFSFTDLIASLVMAMGFYKLYNVNTYFKGALYTVFGLSAVGLAELVVEFYAMFSPSFNPEAVFAYTTIPRSVIIAVFTLFMLMGIESVADEVRLPSLAKRARLSMPFALIVYGISALLEIPYLEKIFPVGVLAALSVVTLISVLILTVINLTTIYSSYMKICMPDEVDNDVDKPSRFGFVNKYREHTEKKQREYAEYKLEKLKKKNSKKK